MAPEQARGKEIGPAADVFAWGSLIAYAATGGPPFGTGTPEALLYRVVHEAPRLAGVPDELQKPVADSLRKSPNERPDANVLLRRCLGDETATDADETTSLKVSEIMDKTWRLEAYSIPVPPSRRVQRRALLLLPLGLALVAAAIVVPTIMPDEQRPPARSEIPSVSSPQTSPIVESPPDARDVPIRQLLRPGAAKDKVVIGDMDSQSPEEIIVASSDVGSDPFLQRYLDIYSWNGSRWKRIFDATNYVAPDADGTVLPFGTSVQGLPGRTVDFLRLIDFHGDGAPELAAGISSYGASSGPLDVWILSKIDRRVRSDFHSITERGGTLRQRDDVLELETGSYAGDDPMCCPSFIETSLIGSEGGVIKVLDASVVDSPNALRDIDEFPLQLDGIGPVRVGMTLDEAADALGTAFEITFDHGSCKYAQAQGFNGPALMLLDGRIARVDVYAGSIRTISGIGIGSTEQEVFDTYGSQIRGETHPYDPQGNYLIYTPQDADDAELSMIFETDGSSVTSFRSGFEEAVALLA